MVYPGDQGRTGGRSEEQPPPPFGPGAPDGPEQTGIGPSGEHGSPFSPPPGAFAARPGEATGPVGEPLFPGPFDQFDQAADEPSGPNPTPYSSAFSLNDVGDNAGGPIEPPSDYQFDASPSGPYGPPPSDGFDPSPYGPSDPFPAEPGSAPNENFNNSPYGPSDPFPAEPGAAAQESFDSGMPYGQGAHPGPGSFGGSEELYGARGEQYFEDPGPGRHSRPDERAAETDEPRRNKPLLVAGAAVGGLALVAAGFVGSSLLSGDDSKSGQAAAATKPTQKPEAAPAPTPTPSAQLNAKLKSRATDPAPLTLKEVFSQRTFTSGGQKYTRTAWKQERNCANTVNGSKLEAALKKGGCVQVLRATYSRGDGKLIGTIGVLNLKTENAAKTADKAGSGREAYLQPLAGTGVTKKIGKGNALGTSFVRGHYLIMTWVQRPDGKAISSKSHKTVSNFQQQIILGSNLGKALHYRGIEGKPLTS